MGVAFGITNSVEHHASGSHVSPAPLSCAPPTPQALRAVDRLFGAQVVGQDSGDQQAAAQDTGLHAMDINSDLGGYHGVPPYNPQNDIDLANDDMNQFGITIQDGIAGGEIDGFSNPTRAELDASLDTNLDAITSPFVRLPIELVHLSGIKKIILMDNPRSDMQYVFDKTGEKDLTLVWNINAQPNPQSMEEALYKGVDNTECPTSNKNSDVAYAALNGSNIYDGAGNHAGLTFLQKFAYGDGDGGYTVSVGNWLLNNDPDADTAFESGSQTGNYEKFCYILNHYEQQIIVPSQESFKNSEVDKDDLGTMLIDLDDDNYAAILNPHSPDIRKKALFLLARLYELSPKVVQYLADITDRSDQSPYCP